MARGPTPEVGVRRLMTRTDLLDDNMDKPLLKAGFKRLKVVLVVFVTLRLGTYKPFNLDTADVKSSRVSRYRDCKDVRSPCTTK